MMCKKSKRSQAAMEFLMTYGWALLVVVASISALAYFGVLKQDKFLPEKCSLPAGLACTDFKISTSNIELVIQNSLGRDITIHSITIGNCTQDIDQELNNGDGARYMVDCDNGEIDTKFKGDILINVTNKDTSIQKTLRGDIIGKVQ